MVLHRRWQRCISICSGFIVEPNPLIMKKEKVRRYIRGFSAIKKLALPTNKHSWLDPEIFMNF